jgi:hypothetical protein
VIALLIVVAIFVLTSVQSKWGLGKSKWSLIFFICGAFLGAIGAVSVFSAINGEHFAPIVARFYSTFGLGLTKAAIIFTFLLLLSAAGISGGIFVVWVGDRLTSVRKSA